MNPQPELPAGADEIDTLVTRANVALLEYEQLDQAAVDHIVKKASVAALNKHGQLALAAVEETGRGVFEDKATKNIFTCENVTHSMRNTKTVGIISRDDVLGIIEIAEPVGVVAGITPVTNPTSTAIFKSLIALKTRCPIVFAFHPAAQNCSLQAAEIVRDAAIAAGAPENCIQWVETPSIENTGKLMEHPGVALILATGGNAMVRAAYSCGKPALGVGAGNVPAYIEESAKLGRAVTDIVLSKNFDNGMVCASEQAAIIDASIYDAAMTEFRRLHAYVCTPEEKTKLEQFIFGASAGAENCAGAKLNASVVGQSPVWIAENAGFTVPDETTVLLAEVTGGVGPIEPLTREKLAPVLAVLKAPTREEALDMAVAMVRFDGLGHSAAIHTEDKELIEEFGNRCSAVRIIANSPTSLGGIGDVYNAFIPSLTLGCGSYGRNSVSNNVSAVNLLNIKRIGARTNNLQWFKVPAKTYFEPNAIRYLTDMKNVERVTIVADHTMTRIGFVDQIRDVLKRRANDVMIQVYDDVEPEPSIGTVLKGAETMRAFKPDTIIALGGGSPMDAAKIMWLLYEHPDTDFSDLREKYLDVRKRAFKFPPLGDLAKLVCIPTTSGTGAEVTPFAVIGDPETGFKYPLADYALTPTVAIVDPNLTELMPSFVAADSGMDALTHATEAFVSVYANDFTDGMALQAIKLIFANIEKSVLENDRDARETMHNAATIAGMAFGNAFLGVVHAMSHTCGSTFKQIHGRTNAVFLAEAIRYNGQIPTKFNSWPKYETYTAPERFQRIARELGLPASTPEEGVESYASACEQLRSRLGMPGSFKEMDIDEEVFMSSLDVLAMRSFEDQCAPANPRIATLEHMKQMMEACYYGVRRDDILARQAADAKAPEPEQEAPEPGQPQGEAPASEQEAPEPEQPQGEAPAKGRRRSSGKKSDPTTAGQGGGW